MYEIVIDYLTMTVCATVSWTSLLSKQTPPFYSWYCWSQGRAQEAMFLCPQELTIIMKVCYHYGTSGREWPDKAYCREKNFFRILPSGMYQHPAGTSEFCSFFERCRSLVPCKYPLISFQSGHKLQKWRCHLDEKVTIHTYIMVL